MGEKKRKPILIVCPMHWDYVMNHAGRKYDKYVIQRGAVCDLC